ncbi:hypothetical protein ACFVSZ_29475, partial [Priestia megaterium]|uniref:hypothetical protein n=1 Tax=Priestia megaterium TaxID=1404 RepID=UPI0036DCE94A
PAFRRARAAEVAAASPDVTRRPHGYRWAPRRRMMLPQHQHALGGTMASYNEVQTAVRAEKVKLWLGWAAGIVIALIIASATRNIAIVSVITQVLLVVVFLLLTFTVFRMTTALNRKADAARARVLDED